MRVIQLEATKLDVPQPVVEQITSEKRGAVSGPSLKAFMEITKRWELNETQQRVLLGDPPRATFYNWVKKAEDGSRLKLSLDTLLRISAVLGIHKALCILFVHQNESMIWLKGRHDSLQFAGKSPLDTMLNGTQDDLMTVRRYLDAWRGGLGGAPAPESDVPAVRPEDIVWA